MYEQNPDSRLAVMFYSKEVENSFQTQVSGKPVTYMADFVRIEIPGDRNTIIDTFVTEDHKARFPIQWARYLNEKRESAEPEVQGTSLKNWTLLTPPQVTELRHLKFYTVEQIANASDQQISSLGMMVGMAGTALRDKARAYLRLAEDSSIVAKQQEELKKAEEEKQAQAQRIAQLEAAMAELTAHVKRGPGRPKKETEAA